MVTGANLVVILGFIEQLEKKRETMNNKANSHKSLALNKIVLSKLYRNLTTIQTSQYCKEVLSTEQNFQYCTKASVLYKIISTVQNSQYCTYV